MWMMSNSPANDALRVSIVGIWLLTSLPGLTACAVNPAPNTAKQRQVIVEERPASINRMQLTRPLFLQHVQVRRFDKADPKMAKIASPVFLRRATEPLLIELQLDEPVDITPRDSMLAIVINGTPILETWIHPEANDRLIAILPNRDLLKDRNTVGTVWLGAESETLTRKPLVFWAKEIR